MKTKIEKKDKIAKFISKILLQKYNIRLEIV